MTTITENLKFQFKTHENKNGEKIVSIKYASDLIDIEDIDQYLKFLDQYFYIFGKLYNLILLDQDSELTVNARRYLLEEKKKRKEYFLREAIVVCNFGQVILAKHYAVINGKYYPIQIFHSENEAISWLSNTILT